MYPFTLNNNRDSFCFLKKSEILLFIQYSDGIINHNGEGLQILKGYVIIEGDSEELLDVHDRNRSGVL